jgi:hypothetical protein
MATKRLAVIEGGRERHLVVIKLGAEQARGDQFGAEKQNKNKI